jgi:hypothetical protein
MPVLDMTASQRRRPIRPAARRTRPSDTSAWEAERSQGIAPEAERPADWGTLGGTQVERREGRASRALMGISTLHFVLLVIAASMLFTLYVGHVYATQNLLTDLQDARRDNLELHLRHNRLKAAFDGATSPSVILPRAQALGLEEGLTYGPTLTIDAD